MGLSKLITCDEGLRYVPALCESKGVPPTAVKSVTGDTPIVLMENGKCVYTPIGDWIDAQLAKEPHNVQHFTERQMELLNLENEVYIPTTDEHGKVTWGAVTAITRHDPGTELYEIKTLGGRSVIVTESKSLLTWHPHLQQFKEVNTPDIKVGDFLPVTAELVDPPQVIQKAGGFSLNFDNGFFVGLYVANGDNFKDPGIATFAESWLQSHSLREFLCAFGNINQEYIPSIAFTAPKQFVAGLLSGYFSARGSIADNALSSDVSTQRLVEGIAMLCSRLGVFCEMHSSKIVVCGESASLLAKHLCLLPQQKQDELENLKCKDRNFQAHNNVVLDKITEINVIDTSKYPKVYDLTIPSTLNFGLANGLQVRDTSQTGYIQRKLVKAMEDCKVSYDMTVRNANGNIIQFLYGEDGMDAIKIESQPLYYIEMTPDKIEAEYLISARDDFESVLSRDALKALKAQSGWKERCFEHYKQLIADREFFIKRLFDGEQENMVLYPISFVRIINNVHALCKRFRTDGLLSDLLPTYVLDEIDKLHAEVFVSRNDKGTKMFEMLSRMYLSPKQMIFKFGLDKSSFDKIIDTVRMRFYDSIVHPSEMVGVVAAQSIGEPLSQTTLNSVEWNTELLLDVDGKLQRVRIGEFVDDIFGSLDNTKVEHHPNDTTLGWIQDKNVKILSCDKRGHITWKAVEAVTRHPVINKDGSNTLIKVTLKSGRQVTATKGHSFLKRINNEIVGVDGDTLTVNDYLPISTVLPVSSTCIELDANTGFSIGESLATQTVSGSTWEQVLKDTAGDIRLPAAWLAASDEFLANLIRGYFSVVSSTQQKELLEDLQQILTKLGVKSAITSGTLVVSEDDVHKFREISNSNTFATIKSEDVIPNVITEEFGDLTIRRREIDDYITKCTKESDRDIFKRLKEENVYYDKIVSIEEVPNKYPHAYDLTVEDTRTFNTYNGITQFDTFHLSGVSSASKAVRGVPRIEELTRVTKNVKAPSMVIFLRDPYRDDKAQCMEIKNKIETTTFKDIYKRSKIFYDPEDSNTTIESDAELTQLYREFQLSEECERSASPWLLRLELDKSKMLDMGLTMIDLHHALLSHFGNRVSCMFTDDNVADLVFRIKLYEDVSESSNDMLTDLKALESTILESVILKGINKLNKVELIKQDKLMYDEDTQTFQKAREWCLDTDGTNLIEVLGLPYVDATRTVSNDVNEVYKIFGIEAARQCLYNEIYSVIKDAEAHVNFRHLSLLVDTMTSKGTLMSIDRHGINKGDIGPLAKCSFEEVNDVLVKAGVFSELDRVNGVSANIMLGQIAPCGTGDTEILIDESKLQEPRAEPEVRGWDDEEFDLQKEEFCDIQNFRLDFALPDEDPKIQRKAKVA